MSSSGGGPVHPPGDQAVIQFDVDGTIELAPGEVHSVSVLTSPPAAYEVKFALLGDALDASLDHTTVFAGDDGRATISLHAPNQSTTFRLRATISGGSASAEAQIAVSDKGFGTVLVHPVYAGKRAVKKWVASVVARSTCADLAATLPGDSAGAPQATAGPDQMPEVKSVPVGPNLAVAIRAGHYMWGCSDATGLVANSTLSVDVNVIDKPVDLAATDMTMELEYAPDPEAYAKILTETTKTMIETVVPAGEPEAQALLDAMQASALDPLGFSNARAMASWDVMTADALTASGISLAQAISSFATAGLATQPPVLGAHLTGGQNMAGAALVTVTKIGDETGDEAGIMNDVPMTWTAMPDDSVVLGGSIAWLPSRFVGAATFHAAKLQIPGVVSMPDAMSKIVGCPSIAAGLGGYAGCDVACLTQLCQTALDDMWKRATDSSQMAGVSSAITVNATAQASVDDVAAPASVDGIWLGSVGDGTTSASVKGTLTGKATMPAPP